ncbi:uncharacterized protein FOMMEDRAFT_156211 [Fomitiporia mediterranea MF3/22]|uniref:uncharacterized protein n=1 Tax=Fomitiporia mediterranea (strain MF3/22) TaxID=694068 RepID=UPI00044093CC|nr:uncharacterized protein FOMMEDRAFT_156211 [Fomitiporia mediterranea MF3/22]EJD02854.1 hypothetical protein FOMMEDRAFT_156211 [Fomitiporia mediterranea MF3/22]
MLRTLDDWIASPVSKRCSTCGRQMMEAGEIGMPRVWQALGREIAQMPIMHGLG